MMIDMHDDYLITSHSFRPRTAEQFLEDHEVSYQKRLTLLGIPFNITAPDLTILIPTCKKHEKAVDILRKELDRQGLYYTIDDREDIDLGTKRQDLYKNCETTYALQFDSDDWIAGDFRNITGYYLENADNIDCFNFLEHVVMGNQTTLTRRSLHFPWSGCMLGNQYCFSPNTKSIIRTELAREVEFEKGHQGEDLAFGRDLRKFLTSETNIDYIGYYYEYSSEGSCTQTNEHQVRKEGS